MLRSLLATTTVLTASAFAQAPAAARLHLNKSDTIAMIGNSLPDRMQHHGWFEAMLYSKFPELDLRVRNLAFAGDEVSVRNRSENFGSEEEWLTRVKADVVFAFFGFNESFQGAEGLPKFEKDLQKLIRDTKAANYSGKGFSRIVLFSPIALEKPADPDIPDITAKNAQIKLYAHAMGKVAAAEGVPFVDLFTPSQAIYQAAAGRPALTVNGWYLTDEGDKRLAPALLQALLGTAAPSASDKLVTDLREAVLAKSKMWHSRYRTVDSYNIVGGRSRIGYESGPGGPKITNAQIMSQEMNQREVMTSNRDLAIWSIAKGKPEPVNDSNLSPVSQIDSNKPGPEADGKYDFVSGEDAIKLMKPADHVKVQLFADEALFPEMVNPVQMNWDTKGRLWVSVWPNYPERTPTDKDGDSILILEDTNHDGKADKCTTFAKELNCPTGFQFYRDGILLMQSPDLIYLRDTDGDDKADAHERVLMGLDAADSHHETNSMCLENGGAVYCSDGVFHRSQVETYDGPFRNTDGGIYRYEPRTGKFGMYASYGFANPHGRVFDAWGNDFVTDATGNNTYFGAAFSSHLTSGKHAGLREFWARPSRPCPGTNILSSRHFPDDWQGDFLNLNVIGFQGIFRVDVDYSQSGPWGTTAPDLISSTDPNFRPSGISVGPDGALYMLDWHNPIIGHLQHHLRDPSRDHLHGRVYKLTYEGRPLLVPVKIAAEPTAKLLDLLKEPENNVRERTKTELSTRDSKEVIAALGKWVTALDPKDPGFEHQKTEALWVHQWLNQVDRDLLADRLASPDPRARAAAVRVVCYWRDMLPDSVAILKKAVLDPDAKVRLHAIRAASFLGSVDAVDIALAALSQPMDYYVQYVFDETMRELGPVWRQAISKGQPVSAGNAKGMEYLYQTVSTADLLTLPKNTVTMNLILQRGDASEVDRVEAADGLSKASGKSISAELCLALQSATDDKAAADLGRLLNRQPAGELKASAADLTSLSTSDKATVRQAASAALMLAEGTMEKAWAAATQSVSSLSDFLHAVPMISDPAQRSAAYEKVSPLLKTLPEKIQSGLGKEQSVGRFVRIELPRRGTLTLAEVEVMSGGKNIARKGTATQKTTSNGGSADKAIDGNTSGSFNDGGETHTVENTRNPWWELDLGSAQPIDSVTVWNRSEQNGAYVKRLDGFTLTVLDAGRSVVFQQEAIPAPPQKATIALKGDPEGDLLRASILALTSIGREPQACFQALAALIHEGRQRNSAAAGMLSLPRASWDKAAAGAAAKDILVWAKTVPVGQRTDQSYVELTQAASELAGQLPTADANAIRKELRSIGVPVFVMKTVREQMRYDKARLIVETGKQFDIILDNEDAMPHNLVISQPGSKDEIALQALTLPPTKKDSEGRAYLPPNNKILAATKLLEAGQTDRITVSAINKDGSYDLFCTFPGHAPVMWGKLIVAPDVDAYLAAHPQPEELPPTFSAE